MRISVVLCTYSLDMYGHFREAAQSILRQTYDDIELVVIVDGTPEVTDRVEDDYGEHPDVTIECNKSNQGLLMSRNRGARIASGDIVAFIDDDAVADETWVERLVAAYEEHDPIAVGGKMTPKWVAGQPTFLPAEFYWLVGVTHRGFADEPGEVRNTFGSNISFRREAFSEVGGFDPEIGGRKGDKNLQGGETELCARVRAEYGKGVWYVPSAEVAHKVFEYRTNPRWLIDRAFWQGYSKNEMETLVDETTAEEADFLGSLISAFVPKRLSDLLQNPSRTKATQLLMLVGLTASVGAGYLYGAVRR